MLFILEIMDLLDKLDVLDTLDSRHFRMAFKRSAVGFCESWSTGFEVVGFQAFMLQAVQGGGAVKYERVMR